MSDDWKSGLRLKLETLVDDCVTGGGRQADVLDAIEADIARLRTASERDPDPADDDPVEEPANDWPAAT